MQACCRCKSAAGFWVMAKDAVVVRRPWCLSCVTELLDKDEMAMTRIGLVAPPRAPSSGAASATRADQLDQRDYRI